MDSLGYTYLIVVCSIVSGLSVVTAYFIDFPEQKQDLELQGEKNNKLSLKNYFETRVIPMSLISICLLSVYGGIVSFIAIYANEIGILKASAYFLGVLSFTITVIRPFSGKISDKLGAHIVIIPGMLLTIVGLIFLSQANTMFIFLLSALFIGFGFGSVQPSLHSLVISAVTSERRGAATATYYMSVDIGIASGAFILGIVANFLGYAQMFLMSSVYILLGIVVYVVFRITNTKAKHDQKDSQEIDVS